MKNLLIIFILFPFSYMYAQSDNIPVTTYKGNDLSKPLIFYITGDGGWNSFSTSLVTTLNKDGYSVIGLNSRYYFWKKKTPKQLASDVSTTLNIYLTKWKLNNFVLIGYSFGADVTPFIETRLPKNLHEDLKKIILMSVSKKTDFEIHVLGMIGMGGNSGEDVVAEINRLTCPAAMIFGSDEKEFPLRLISNKNASIIHLAGGHHYDGNVDELIKTLKEQMK